MRECHIYSRHVADLQARKFCAARLSNSFQRLSHRLLRWMDVCPLCVCVWVEERQVQLVKCCGRDEQKGRWSGSLHDSVSPCELV